VPPRASRAFSLVEVLIAIGLVATVAALAAPAVLGRLERGSFKAAQDSLAAAVRTTRDRAMRENAVLELLARTTAGEPVRFMVATHDGRSDVANESDFGEFAGLANDAIPESAAPPDPGSENERRAEEVARLPDGLTVQRQDDVATGVDALLDLPPEAMDGPPIVDPLTGEAEADEVLIAIVLPSGIVIPEQDLLLAASDGGRYARISINRWTGATTFQPFDPEGADGLRDGDAGNETMGTPLDGAPGPGFPMPRAGADRGRRGGAADGGGGR
jgi:Tfp pilus assembly protein FimT